VILLDRQTNKINRQVDFLFAPVFDPQDSTGSNNTWKYNRAPDGYKFVLESIDISVAQRDSLHTGVCAIYDGHEYTHWNQFPGVESKELLGRFETNAQALNNSASLHNWECKEFTIGVRSLTESFGVKIVVIIWYYLRKMSWLEKLQYAVIQPKGQRYRKSGPTTVERSERLDL